ncbi:DUF1028 domain-containing protein [Halobacillus locisalis]|uniref:DUF1028 domain-containing protein n=1 Tax=Halobacillus locisalis TaxID=220753 RepID=A0A838CRC1_9BACI|nr:DUF1028 domain-containing protein [Halobacillus locisalis]
MTHRSPIIATFSIVGSDPATGELGVAVQSKFLGVGSVVPWAKAGVGAIATQAFANPAYGPDGLKMLEEGLTVEEVFHELTTKDPQSQDRQLGIVDTNGNAESFTGNDCYEWAGGVTGKGYAAQGNILVNKETVTEMGKAFEEATGSLADRLLAGLQKAQQAGGDSRGKQSAALYVVKEKGGYGGLSDTLVDLRVDDHPDPIVELERIYQLHQLYFGETNEEDILKVEAEVMQDVTLHLYRLGYISSRNVEENELYRGLTTYLHTENFEGREQHEGWIDKKVYEYLLEHNS